MLVTCGDSSYVELLKMLHMPEYLISHQQCFRSLAFPPRLPRQQPCARPGVRHPALSAIEVEKSRRAGDVDTSRLERDYVAGIT